MACFCLGGGSWLAMSNRDFIRASDVSFSCIVLHTETGLVECREEEHCRDSDKMHDHFL